jgi:hypothetical protein
MPMHLRRLMDAGITPMALERYRGRLSDYGITLAYVRSKGWVFQCIGRTNDQRGECGTTRLWLGSEDAVAEKLANIPALVQEFAGMGASVRMPATT